MQTASRPPTLGTMRLGAGTVTGHGYEAMPRWGIAAIVVIALHVVVDAFVVPQPGTAWTDHLAAGLVPTALLVVCALSFARLRPGACAALAGLLGVLALEGAVLAVTGLSRGTARPVDWTTGLLLWPAGLVLLVIAVALLWRSRRRGGRVVLRRASIALAAFVGAYWLLLPVAVAIYATHRPREVVRPADLGVPYRSVELRTADGLELAAWYAPSRNGAAVVSFPTRSGALPEARMLIRHGYGVLLLDMRGYGGSDGAPNAFGWGATPDVDAAVAWLGRQPDVRGGRIGGIGFSVGGEQMLEAAAGNPRIRAVVSEGAGERSIRETLLYGLRGLPSIPTAAVQTAAVAILGDTLPPPSLEQLVARIAPRPILLVYAGRGGGGEDLNPTYHRAAGQPKLLWEIPEAEHVGGLAARPLEYERRVVGFLDRALGVS